MSTKSIRMPKALLEAWLNDLRTGNAKQGHGLLQDLRGGFCCLGRLQVVADGDVERISPGGYSLGLPSDKWCESHGVTNMDGKSKCLAWGVGTTNLPALNDTARMPFSQIADLVEAHVEGY